jgi:dienelactone hydrolase/pimeloyl-ACP methyl ester carboxylesterase
MMSAYLTKIVEKQFAARDDRLARLDTAEDWKHRADEIRSAMIRWADLPDQRTPLKARVTGRLEREQYVVEKLLFESRPQFVVSANLYLPKGYQGPRPAILNVLGHNSAGKMAEEKQRRCVAQAKRGFVALIIDGIGQGERRIEDYEQFGQLPGAEHRTVGAQAFLAGTHLFSLMAWDVIRAVDYLCSRSEVNCERIGITGTSGGGMMSTYILPLEPRIKVSVPACNPNTWSHRVRANLSTDHEQVFFGAFNEGIDPRGDPLFVHVPRPLLINATTDDNLNPPRGVWELHSWLYRAYSAFGQPDRLQTTMIEAGHDYNREQREITYAWMMRWLLDDVAPYVEGDPMLEDEEDLWRTPKGDVYATENSLTPSELAQAHYLKHRVQLQSPKTQPELMQRKRELAELTQKLMSLEGNTPVPSIGEKALRVGSGWTARPILLRPEKRILLPGVWLQADRSSRGPVVLFLSEKGKEVLAEEKQVLYPLLEKGYRVLAVDLRGTGETAPGKERYFWDFLAGRPIFGQRVKDILSIFTWLGKQGIPMKEIRVWAQGLPGLQAAFACLRLEPVGGLVLENVLTSYEDVIMNRLPRFNHEILLPGVASQMDFSDVYGALCPVQLTLINPLRSDKSVASQADAERALARTAETYQNLKVRKLWSVETGVEGLDRSRLITEALMLSMPN